jgi:glycosyltransferase involved in cell wall biosynthesis
VHQKTLFVYSALHPSLTGFAEEIAADFWPYRTRGNYFRSSRTFHSLYAGIQLPHYSHYLSAGGGPLIPVMVHNILTMGQRKRLVHINLAADPTFMLILKTPPQLRREYSWVVNTSHHVAVRFIDGAIAVSSMIRDCIHQVADIPVRIVHPYIDPRQFISLSANVPQLDSQRLLSVAYNSTLKGMDLLVDAFRIVQSDFPKAELTLVGKNYPRSWENLPGVHIPGYVADPTPCFHNAGLYIQPSRADAFPVSSLESLCAGVPSMVTDHTGTKEVVERLDPALVRKVDSKDIAEGIFHYFTMDLSEKVRLSREAKQLSHTFLKSTMCPLFKDQYAKLLSDVETYRRA